MNVLKKTKLQSLSLAYKRDFTKKGYIELFLTYEGVD